MRVLMVALLVLVCSVAHATDERSPGAAKVSIAIAEAFKASELSRNERRALTFLAVGIAADIYTTRQGLARGCREMNPLYGKDPSTGLLVGAGVLQFGFFTYAMARPGRDESKWGYIAGGVRLAAAAWNTQQDCRG